MQKFPFLWYENDKGERSVPPDDCSWMDLKELRKEYPYQWSRFPSTIHETVLRLTETGSERVAKCTMGYNSDLMLAMCRPTLWERFRALLRGHWIRTMSCDQAQIHAALACEACNNSLAYEHGLSWGYRRGSAGWRKAHARCELCHPKVEA